MLREDLIGPDNLLGVSLCDRFCLFGLEVRGFHGMHRG